MANTATVQEVTMTHKDSSLDDIVVPVTSVRVWEKSGWSLVESADKKLVKDIEEGKASPVETSVEGDPANTPRKKTAS